MRLATRTFAARAAAIVLTPFVALAAAQAQRTADEWWPEVDYYLSNSSNTLRLFAFGSATRTADDPDRRRAIGVHLDYGRASWGFVAVGYHYYESGEQRVLFQAGLPNTTGKLRFRSRTRVELRWLSGVPSQRVRERLRLEGETTAPWGKKRIVPYTQDEIFYDSRYRTISRNRFYVGAELWFDKHFNIDVAICREDDRFSSTPHINAFAPKLVFRY
ncbi:MAG TPA: DUF2490 domain-containing protein [Gemmatimonadaceae bacterium]|nr:DUF2490 domain-containing protein [Gemmatimonadaceae bacterium]